MFVFCVLEIREKCPYPDSWRTLGAVKVAATFVLDSLHHIVKAKRFSAFKREWVELAWNFRLCMLSHFL